MNKQKNRIPPALRHGCYSGLSLLPTEDRAEFEKMRRDIIAEYRPSGRSEQIIVAHLADLLWRRENLLTYRLAGYAKIKHELIYSRLHRQYKLEFSMLGMQLEEETRSPEELRALRKEADEQAQRELGPVQELIAVGNAATSDELQKDLELLERLDGAITRTLKQLLLVRGVKSISASP